jgi:FSR family fosmidomycin resistance protein-like MFS transporter
LTKTPSAQHTNVKIIFALTLVHFIGDFYNSFITPLLPLFIAKYSLTLAQAGMIAGLSRFLAFIVQPPVGYLADRHPTRFFALGGPLLVMVFIPLAGIAPAFWILLVCVSLGSIGSSMFHPTVAGMVSRYAGRNLGFSMSIFVMGGTLSFGVGPLFITWFVKNFGLDATPLTTVIGLAIMVFLFKTVPLPVVEGLKEYGLVGSIREVFGEVWKPVVLVWLVMVLRAFVAQSYLTFMPILFAKEGYTLISIGWLVSLFTVAGAISGMVAGYLADRIGYKSVFLAAHALTVPCMLLLLYLRGSWVFPAAFLTGFFNMATLPLGVALVQKLAPRGKSMASSLMTGLAFGVGGLLTPLTGLMADFFSIRSVLGVLAVFPLITIILICFLPGNNHNWHEK